MGERIQEIDIAKGIGILLVLIGHSIPYESNLHTWIYSFHMPLFFILSGLVMNAPEDISFRGLLKKNIKLITNYVLWSGIYFIFDMIVRFIILRQTSFHSMFWEAYQTVTFYGINVLWFFSTLFIAKMITSIILKKSKFATSIIIGGVLLAIAVTVGTIINKIEITNFTSIFIYPAITIARSLSVVIFLVGGYRIKPFIIKWIKQVRTQCISFGALSILLTFVCCLKVGTVDIHALRFGNPFILLVSSFGGFIGVICVSKLTSFNKIGAKVLIFLGTNSSLIMATHEYLKVKDLISIAIENVINVDSNLYIIIEIVSLILVEICICKLWAKYVDRIIDSLSVFLYNKITSVR